MNEEIRQRMIVRQSSLKLAVDLLTSEQDRANSPAMIPIESIKRLTRELEAFVFELDVPDNRQLNPQTGQVMNPQQEMIM